jgi:hypothetical protein
MSDHDIRRGRPAAKSVAGVVVAAIVLNVLLRVVPLPDLDLPSISIPRPPDWLHAVLKVKNWLLLAIIAVIVIGVVIEQSGRDRDEPSGER